MQKNLVDELPEKPANSERPALSVVSEGANSSIPADRVRWDRGAGSSSRHEPGRAGTQDIPTSCAAWRSPCVGVRHHLYSDGERPSLSGGDHRLGEPCSAGLAAFEYDGHAFGLDALEEALERHGKPQIFNTDQGAQFTSASFTAKLEAAGIATSVDGRGRFMDNIFIERLWRWIKYEEVHLKAYADGREARAGIGSWMTLL